MTANDARFEGSIPTLYEQMLVPLLFEPFAKDIASRLRDIHEGVVLETAAGTGAATRALRDALPAAVRIVATDLNEGMLKIAEARSKAPALTWTRADAQALPFGDAEFDAVVCQFGMMFLPDKAAGYREARRVLRAGGRFVFNVWERLEHNEVTRVVAERVAAMFPADPPRFFERVPFGYNDPAVLRRDLEGAGFARIEIVEVDKVTRPSSAEVAAVGLCKGTPLRGEIDARGPGRLDAVTREVEDALAARFGRASFDNRMRALVVTAFVV